MTLFYVALVVAVLVLVGLAVRYFGPRLKPPPLAGPPPPSGPRPRELFVADEGTNTIWVFGINDDGTLIRPALRRISGGALGDPGLTQLNKPIDIAVDSGGTTFVLNQILDQQGNLIPFANPIVIFPNDGNGNIAPTEWWGQDILVGGVQGCMAVSANNDSLLVGMAGDMGWIVQQIDKFRSQATHGLGGTISGLMGNITGIATRGPSYVVVQTSEQDNQMPQYAVLFFAFTPGFENVVANPTQTIVDPALNRPQRVTFGPDGSIFVTNWGWSKEPFSASVTIFAPDAQGNFKLARQISGSVQTRLLQPTGIAVSDDGIIYVADSGDIKVFDADAYGDARPRSVNVDPAAQITGLAFHIPKQ
jgi:DNA-binding beta-propeller fold protein YncE